MKILRFNLLGFLTILCAATGCKDDGHVTLPFKAEFFTVLVSFEEDAVCSAPQNFLNTQEGAGTATHLGKFSTRLTFCMNPNTLEYENVQGGFTAENGDEIFITGGGQVFPSDEPGYELEFMDDFIIIGGKGRFEGASGNLTSRSFVDMETQQTDHVWTGTIIMVK